MVSRRTAWAAGLAGVALTAVICGGVILHVWKGVSGSRQEAAESLAGKPEENAGDTASDEADGKATEAADRVQPESGEDGSNPSVNQGKNDSGAEDEKLRENQSADRQTGSGAVNSEELRVNRETELYTYEDLQEDIALLSEWYPDLLSCDSLTETFDGRELYHLVIGDPHAEKKIFFNGGIHAREYITSPLVMKQAAAYLEHIAAGDSYREISYQHFWEDVQIHVVPMVNPDGIAISQKGLEGIQTEKAREQVENIARLDGQSPEGSYLTGWKANANGVDLNRNFDALWEEYQDPAGHPSADHYKGESPGCETESSALIELTEAEDFDRTVSYHTQGNVIYWYFAQEGQLYTDTLEFAQRISRLTGYPTDGNYQSLDPAGYKDWAISSQGIPSLTIEVGRGTSPVPLEQFAAIWRENEYVWEETLLDLEE